MDRTISTAIAVTGLLAAGSVQANLIKIECLGEAPLFVADGDPVDLDPLADRIRVEFDIERDDGVNIWRATGTAIGIFDPSQNATTRLENTTIRNVQGNVHGFFFLTHTFQSPLGPPDPDNNADISAHFDNVNAPGYLNGAGLTYWTRVVPLGGAPVVVDTAGWFNLSGAAPIDIAHAGGPVNVLRPIEHQLELNFYLDSPGDALIIGEGEGIDIEAAPVPAPSAWLAAAGLLIACRRRRAPRTGVES